MKDYFDWHEWNARFCKNIDEVDEEIKALGIIGKKIKKINIIGMAANMDSESCEYAVRRTLMDAGVDLDDICDGKYPYLDKTLLPRKVEICEPVVFVFEDNSTFELMPFEAGIQMSVNKIPPTLTEGTNENNFNADIVFRSLIGQEIKDVRYIEQRIESQSGGYKYKETCTIHKYEFDVSGDFGFYISRHGGGMYEFDITKQNHSTYCGRQTDSMTYKEALTATKNKSQIFIQEGRDYGGTFWIIASDPTKEYHYDPDRDYREDGISIDEGIIDGFLYYFLLKYYVPQITRPYREEFEDDGFDWYGGNAYTYDTVKLMLEDIKECAALLEEDYYNPALADIRKRFQPSAFYPGYWELENPPANDVIIKKNIDVAISFYKRFCRRMEAMMKYNPDCNLIFFTGP